MLISATRTLGAALEDKARRFGDKPFLSFESADGECSGPWSWAEFDRHANRAAHFLVKRGVAPGQTVNLHLGNCPEFLLFWMAAAKVGAVMVPTNPVSTA